MVASERPVIGVAVDIERSSSNARLFSKSYTAYTDAVWAAGGWPRLIAPVQDPQFVAQTVQEIEGLVVPGGDDIHPRHLDQEPYFCERFVAVSDQRYAFDLALVEAALARRLPYLGVCYGMQIVNILRGGSIVQDIPDQRPEAARHGSGIPGEDLAHSVRLTPGSQLQRAFASEEIQVNSVHHQSVERAGRGLRVVAEAPDGIIEALESEDPSELLWCVQWHPERHESCGESGPTLFRAFVEAIIARRSAVQA